MAMQLDLFADHEQAQPETPTRRLQPPEVAFDRPFQVLLDDELRGALTTADHLQDAHVPSYRINPFLTNFMSRANRATLAWLLEDVHPDAVDTIETVREDTVFHAARALHAMHIDAQTVASARIASLQERYATVVAKWHKVLRYVPRNTWIAYNENMVRLAEERGLFAPARSTRERSELEVIRDRLYGPRKRFSEERDRVRSSSKHHGVAKGLQRTITDRGDMILAIVKEELIDEWDAAANLAERHEVFAAARQLGA